MCERESKTTFFLKKRMRIKNPTPTKLYNNQRPRPGSNVQRKWNLSSECYGRKIIVDKDFVNQVKTITKAIDNQLKFHLKALYLLYKEYIHYEKEYYVKQKYYQSLSEPSHSRYNRKA